MHEDEPGLVRAAQAGGTAALQELLAGYVPLLYNLVGRSVNGPADADGVTQEVLLRAQRGLPEREEPAGLRSWLVDLAVRLSAEADQIGQIGQEAPAFEDLAVLRLDLRGQERDLVRAGRWLDPEHRTPLALWWEESAGRITRAEVAAALELGEAHTAVRLQRMREQLEQGRTLVAALGREPLCSGLAAVVRTWNGDPNPLWRRQIFTHVHTCVVCLRELGDQLPAARLIAGIPLVPPSAALIETLVRRGLVAADEEEPVAVAEDDDQDYDDEGRWSLVRRAGSAIVVVAAVTLLLFAGGFLYDVLQTPRARTENPVPAANFSTVITTPTPSGSAPESPPTSSK